MSVTLSPKQRQVADSTEEIVIMDGSVRSGKTVAGLFTLLAHAWKHHQGANFILGVYSDHTWTGAIKRTKMLYEQAARVNLDMTSRRLLMPSRDPRNPNQFTRVVCRGIDAMYRIKGDTVAGVFATEVTDYPPELLQEFSFRTTGVKNRKLIYDCNPANPRHWFKTDYIDRAEQIGALHLKFNEGDNPFLTRSAWETIKRETPPGALYRQRINGEWCDETGRIWPHVVTANPPADQNPRAFEVGIDPGGNAAPTHAVLIARYTGADYVVAEYVHDPELSGAKRVADQIIEMIRAFGPKVTKWVVDSADAYMVEELRHARAKHVLNPQARLFKSAKGPNSVAIGIDNVALRLAHGTLRLTKQVPVLADQIAGYVWDPRAAEKGERKPVKHLDHGCDALRYWATTG